MRQNRTTTAAKLEATPAQKVRLPQRFSSFICSDCELGGWDHNRRGFEKNEVPLHEFNPKPVAYHPMTTAWWNTIWDSPMANEWVDADVPGLLSLSTLVDRFWQTGDPSIAAEIRMQQREYGLSPLARRSLQWEIQKVEGKRQAPAVPPVRHRRGAAALTALTGGRTG